MQTADCRLGVPKTRGRGVGCGVRTAGCGLRGARSTKTEKKITNYKYNKTTKIKRKKEIAKCTQKYNKKCKRI